jgi:hypothetical protein
MLLEILYGCTCGKKSFGFRLNKFWLGKLTQNMKERKIKWNEK